MRVVEAPLDGLCWVCRRQAEAHETDLITPVLQLVKFRKKVDNCTRVCDELRIETTAIWTILYRLACGHCCVDHIEHQCCLCRTKAIHAMNG